MTTIARCPQPQRHHFASRGIQGGQQSHSPPSQLLPNDLHRCPSIHCGLSYPRWTCSEAMQGTRLASLLRGLQSATKHNRPTAVRNSGFSCNHKHLNSASATHCDTQANKGGPPRSMLHLCTSGLPRVATACLHGGYDTAIVVVQSIRSQPRGGFRMKIGQVDGGGHAMRVETVGLHERRSEGWTGRRQQAMLKSKSSLRVQTFRLQRPPRTAPAAACWLGCRMRLSRGDAQAARCCSRPPFVGLHATT